MNIIIIYDDINFSSKNVKITIHSTSSTGFTGFFLRVFYSFLYETLQFTNDSFWLDDAERLVHRR